MNILKNYIYSLSYQLLLMILPVITTPYISRVLEVDGIGQYSISEAIANYFILFGMLGIHTYGNRQIAYVRESEIALRNTFWELNIIKAITMGISLVLYVVGVVFWIDKSKKILYLMQVFNLCGWVLDISWLYTGMENFKKTATRSMIVRLISVLLIFSLVKRKNDLWLYALILAGTTFVSQIYLWFGLPRYLFPIEFRKEKLIKHLKNTIQLWIPSIAINVYTSLDKIMLGVLAGDVQVGLYENSQKLVKMAATITTSLSTVLVPRMANLYKQQDKEGFLDIAQKAFLFISFVAIPICFGMIGIRKTLVPWFYGDGYEAISQLLLISSWLVISLGWSCLFGLQILVSCNKENQYTLAVTFGAISNVILNFLLIRKYQAAGAIFASVFAEFFGMFIMMHCAKKYVGVMVDIRYTVRYFIVGGVMSFLIFQIGDRMEPTILTTSLQICIGVIFYLSIMLITKDQNMMLAVDFIKAKIKQ